MFDISTVSKRYFVIKINVETSEDKLPKIQIIEVEPPKLKTLKKITALAKTKDENAMDDLTEAVRTILSKNKAGYKVPEEVIDELDFDQMNEILTAYFEWLSNSKQDPN
jgi:hypothetical protein